MTMRVAIVGSRRYTNKRRIQEFIFKLKQKYGEELEIVSGGQKEGADGYAKKYALEFDIKYSEFPDMLYNVRYEIAVSEMMESNMGALESNIVRSSRSSPRTEEDTDDSGEITVFQAEHRTKLP